SVYSYYLPWHAVDPNIDVRIRDDLRKTRPPVIIFRRDELVNGQWLPRDYAAGLYSFLLAEGYSPLDDDTPLLRDGLVREDCLVSARDRLASSEELQATAAENQHGGVQHEPVP